MKTLSLAPAILATVTLVSACSPASTSAVAEASAANAGQARARCQALVILSAADHLTAVAKDAVVAATSGATKDYPTGFFLDEMAIPVQGLLDAGCRVTFANPSGREPARDTVGDKALWFTDGTQLPSAGQGLVANADLAAHLLGVVPNAAQKAEFAQALQLATAADSPIRGRGPGSLDMPKLLSDFIAQDSAPADGALPAVDESALAEFDAVVIPGGHPPMVDLYQDASLGAILSYFHAHGKVTAAICHGPTALLAATSQGTWAYAGYQMTVVDKIEDQAANVIDRIFPFYDLPFYPTDALGAAGAQLQETPFQSQIVEDRELLTGQQQYSAHAFRDRLVAKINAARD